MLGGFREQVFDLWKKLTDPIGRFLIGWMNSLSDFDEEEARDDAQDDAREQFLLTFASRSWQYLILAVIVLCGVAIVDVLVCGTLQNQTYGLALDLTGAVILGRGLIKGPIPIAEESGQFWGYSPPVIKSLSQDAVDGVFGVTFLVVGILLQFAAITQTYPAFLLNLQSICSALP